MVDFSRWLQATPLSQAIQSAEWIIPTIQSIHIVLIGIVVSSVFMVTARVLGWLGADQSLGAVVDRFAPWIGVGALGLFATGCVLIVGEPARQLVSFSFWAKMALLTIALAAMLAVQRSLSWHPEYWDSGAAFGPAAKAGAAATLAAWAGIIFLGRTIAYDSAIWGALSPQ